MEAPREPLAELFVDAFNARDADGMAALATDDVEIYPLRSVLEDVVYRGRAGLDRWAADLDESWAEIRIELTEVERDPRGVEFIVGHVVARGHESDAPTEAEVYWVTALRDGVLWRLHTFIDRTLAEAAFAKALAEPAVVRAGIDAFAVMDARNADAWHELATRLWTEDIVMVEDPRWPGAGEFHGREEVIGRFREYFEALHGAQVELGEVHRGARDQLVAELVVRARGAESGVPIEQRWAWLITVRDGRLASIRPYLDLAEARTAAGVAPA